VDPRTALGVLEYADLAGASVLRSYCLAVAACNLDAVLIEARGAFEELPPHLVSALERVVKMEWRRSSSWGSPHFAQQPTAATTGAPSELQRMPSSSHRQAIHAEDMSLLRRKAHCGSSLQPGLRPTTAVSRLGDLSDFDDDEDGSDLEDPSCDCVVNGIGYGASSSRQLPLRPFGKEGGFVDSMTAHAEQAARRLLRTLIKKLQQIEHLEQRSTLGASLDHQQAAKVGQRPVILSAMAALESGMPVEEVQVLIHAATTEQAAEQATDSLGTATSTPSAKGKGSFHNKNKDSKRASGSGRGGRGKGKGSSRQRLPSETSILASEPSEMTVGSSPNIIPTPARSNLGGSATSIGIAEASSPRQQIPAFGSEHFTHVVGFAATSASKEGAKAGFLGEQSGRSASKSAQQQQRKGALSMFLRGELDAPNESQKDTSSPCHRSSSPNGCAWGCTQPSPAMASTSATSNPSLKKILDEQTASSSGGGGGGGGGRIPKGPGSASKPKGGGGESGPFTMPLKPDTL